MTWKDCSFWINWADKRVLLRPKMTTWKEKKTLSFTVKRTLNIHLMVQLVTAERWISTLQNTHLYLPCISWILSGFHKLQIASYLPLSSYHLLKHSFWDFPSDSISWWSQEVNVLFTTNECQMFSVRYSSILVQIERKWKYVYQYWLHNCKSQRLLTAFHPISDKQGQNT